MKIALTSTGPLSGKSSLAIALRDHYGFCIANHALTLVQDFVDYYNTTIHYPMFTIDEILENKNIYRMSLQEHSRRVGFSDPERAEYWTDRTLETCKDSERIVFDPFRGEVQAEVMRRKGFIIIQLVISEGERERRAGDKYQQIKEAMLARPDLELGIAKPDYTLRFDTFTPEELAEILMHWVAFLE